MSVSAQTNISKNISYYDVKPDSVEQMLGAFRAASPFKNQGRVFQGNTSTKVWWQWSSRFKKSRCKIRDVKSFVNIDITLPRLAHKHYEADVLFIWDKWYPRLKSHEERHAEIAIAIAEQGVKELELLPSQKNCTLLNEEANKISQALIIRLKKQNYAYDLRTRHGATEGASLEAYVND